MSLVRELSNHHPLNQLVVSPYLEKFFNNIEKQKSELLQELHTQDSKSLSLSANPKKWSVLQILTHLYTSERLSINYVKKKSLGIDQLGNAGIQQALLMPILKISQSLPFRFKAPKVVAENTPKPLSMDQLILQWNILRLDLKAHLENVEEINIHKLVYKHPIAGRLSLPQAMQFFAEHINHHKPQIKKALKVNSNV